MKGKLISVIVPCYNVEKYIDRCIRSLVRQTIGIKKLKLIFVDDASEDNTWNKLKVWERRFPDSIVLISLPENIRQGGARNEGLKYADTQYIGFVDADDWIEETMYQKLYAKADEYSCDVVCCQYIRDHGCTDFPKRLEGEDRYIKIENEEDRRQFMIAKGFGVTCSRLLKRSLIEESKVRFPEKVAYEDNYFMSIINMYAKYYYVMQDVLYHYFINMESTILKKNSLHHLDRIKIELMKINTYKELGVFYTYKNEFEFNFIRLYYLNTMNILLLRFDNFPDHIYEELKNTVLSLFPDYKNNPYLNKFHEMELALLGTIEKDYDAEGLRGLSERYKKVYHWA